jgi:hypothetical protein
MIIVVCAFPFIFIIDAALLFLYGIMFFVYAHSLGCHRTHFPAPHSAEPPFSSVLPSSCSFCPVRQIIKLNELPFGGKLHFGNFGLSGHSPPHCHTTCGVVLAMPGIGNIILAELEVSHYLLPTSKSKHVQTVLDRDLLSQTHSLLANYFRSAPQTAEQYRTERRVPLDAKT